MLFMIYEESVKTFQKFFCIINKWGRFSTVTIEKIDNSIIKRDFVKNYHQHCAQIYTENQSFIFLFRETLTYRKVGMDIWNLK